jgi:S-(hydroxymethyl)glutathione dehydrogenase/alcohol dehydrogenase
MRAALMESLPGTPVIADIEIDEPRAGEVVVRLVACGVCHSDVHAMRPSIVQTALPFLMGHEPAGIIEAVGPGVRHVKPGDHVVACLSGYCGHCAQCLSGHANRCKNLLELHRGPDDPPRMHRDGQPVAQFVGLGGFAERLLVHQHNVVSIDPALPLDRACLLGCGLLTGSGAVWNTAGVTEGATVAVLGAGGVGLGAIQAARISYASRIIAIDMDDEKLELARRCGATDTVNAARDDVVEGVNAIVPGGVDFAFEAIGRRMSTAQQALAITGQYGTCTLIGLIEGDEHVTMTGIDLRLGKVLQQSLMGSARSAVDIPRLAAHALAGRIDLDAMVTHECGLDDVGWALEELEAGRIVGRTVIKL